MAEREVLGLDLDIEKFNADLEQATKRVVELTAEGDKLSKEFNNVEQESRQLTNQLDKLEREGKQNTQQYKQLNRQLSENKRRVDASKTAVQQNTNALTSATNKQKRLNDTLANYNASVTKTTSNVGIFRTNLNSLGGAMTDFGGDLSLGEININNFGSAVNSVTSRVLGLVKSLGAIGGAITAVIGVLGLAALPLAKTQTGVERFTTVMNFLTFQWERFSSVVQTIVTDGFSYFTIQTGIWALQFEKVVVNSLRNISGRILGFFQSLGIFAGPLGDTLTNLVEKFTISLGPEVDNIDNRIDKLKDNLTDLKGITDITFREFNDLSLRLQRLEFDYQTERAALLRSFAEQEAIATDPNASAEQKEKAIIALKEFYADITKLDTDYFGTKERLQKESGLLDGTETRAQQRRINEIRKERDDAGTARVGLEKQINGAVATLRALNTQAIEGETEAIKGETEAIKDQNRELNETGNIIRANTDIFFNLATRAAEFLQGLADKEQELTDKRLENYDRGIQAAEEAFGVESDLARALTKVKAVELGLQAIAELKNNAFLAKLGVVKATQAGAEATANAAKVGFPQNLLTIAATVAQFVGIIASVVSAGKALTAQKAPKFNRGGIIPIGGKRHSQGGTKFYGEDGSRFEAEAGEGLILNRGAMKHIMPDLDRLNRQYGGVSLSKGSGFLRQGGTIQPVFQQMDINRLADAIGSRVAQANRSLPAPQLGLQDFRRQNSRSIRVLDRSQL